MSWLSNRVQAARLRAKNRHKQAKGIRRRPHRPADGSHTTRFLSGAIDEQKERAVPGQSTDKQGGQR